MSRKVKQLTEDDFLGMSDGAGSDGEVVFDENTTEVAGLPVLAAIPEFKGVGVEYPLPLPSQIFVGNTQPLNVVRRTPGQDVAFTASANYIPKDKRKVENE